MRANGTKILYKIKKQGTILGLFYLVTEMYSFSE